MRVALGDMLTIPMGPTGGPPIQFFDVTPIATGGAALAKAQNAAGWLLITGFLAVLYRWRHRAR
jgi:hypothetical protein